MNKNDQPVRVTGDQRRHPAIRKLARACIELARLQLARRPDRPGSRPERPTRTPSPVEGEPRG